MKGLRFWKDSTYDDIFNTVDGIYEQEKDYGGYVLPNGNIITIVSDHTNCHIHDIFKSIFNIIADCFEDDILDKEYTYRCDFRNAVMPHRHFENINRYSTYEWAPNATLLCANYKYIEKDPNIRFANLRNSNLPINNEDLSYSLIQYTYHNIGTHILFEQPDIQICDSVLDDINNIRAMNLIIINKIDEMSKLYPDKIKFLINEFFTKLGNSAANDFIVRVCGIGKIESSVSNTVTVSRYSYFNVLSCTEYDIVKIDNAYVEDGKCIL